MTIGLVGRKCGMTRVFTEDGVSIPVTVVEVEPNRVTQVKSLDSDGYQAIQVTVGERRASRVSKPMAGHFAKANTAAGRRVWTAAAARTKTACPWPGGARQSHAPRITIDMESAATEAPTNLVDLLPSDTIQFPVFRYPGARGL